jgi:hypothetical protein
MIPFSIIYVYLNLPGTWWYWIRHWVLIHRDLSSISNEIYAQIFLLTDVNLLFHWRLLNYAVNI